MSLQQQITRPVDDITAFLPGIGPDEYALRKRIRTALNCSLLALRDAPDGIARNLWICLRDHAEVWTYAPVSIETLTDAADQCRLLWKAIQAADKLERMS